MMMIRNQWDAHNQRKRWKTNRQKGIRMIEEWEVPRVNKKKQNKKAAERRIEE